jgi:hypothetical protein
MRKLLLLGVVSAGADFLAACVQTRQSSPALVISAKRDGDGCRVTVEGERVTSERLLEIGRSSPRRRAIVIYDKDTPYKCIGGAVFTLQRAGLASVEAVMWGG